MRAGLVVITFPAFEQAQQMSLAQRNHEVEALPADGADQPLAQGIGLRTSIGRFQYLQPEIVDRPVER